MKQKKHKKKMDLQLLEHEYNSFVPVAESFCKELCNQLNKLLEDAGIVLGFPIQYRIKKWDSLMGKFERLSQPITSIKYFQDLIGLRIILLFRRDVEKVCNLITGHFTVIRQYDTAERLREDQFGYSSIHFVIELPKQWLAIPTFAKMGALRAEIQLRTLAQHTWAEASQVLQYKQEESVPPSLRRNIYRVSAFLETVDLEFERVLDQRESYRADIDLTKTEEKLNVDLLEKALDSMLPRQNKNYHEPYGGLLNELFKLGVTTQKELKVIIEKHLDSALKKDSQRVEEESDRLRRSGRVIGATSERVKKGVFFNHVGLLRNILRFEFPEYT